MTGLAISRREFLKGSAWAAGLFAFSPAWANGLDEQMPPSYMSFSTANNPFEWTPPTDLHVEPAVLALNRVAFGPRAGEVEAVRAMGLDNYLEEQLSPMSIDDTAMEEMLIQFPSLALSTQDLVK